MRIRILAATMVCSVLPALGQAPDPSGASVVGEAAERAAKEITEAAIIGHTRFLASDLLEGRAPATRGDQLAQEYVADQLQLLGLKPAGSGGSWFQKVPLVGITPKVPESITVSGPGGKSISLAYRADFMAAPGVQREKASIEDAEIVFVGYGIVAPEYRWDDFKDVDVRGKVLLVMNNDPEDDPNLFAGKTRLWYGRWDYKYEQAARKGAAGVVIIHTTPSAGYGWNVIRTSWAGELFQLPDEGGPRLQMKMWATEDASRKIAELGGQNLDRLREQAQKRDFHPVPLGVRLTITTTNDIQQKESGNVLGKLPGSDPKLSRQVVLYTAHHDHFGVKQGAQPGADAIYNGARDNASGVAALLAVARAYAHLPKPPRRTILFASVTAEEQGLLGSEYLAKHPPVAPGEIAADINIDEVNIWGRTRDVSMVGLGKSSLDGLVRAILAAQGRVVKPDPFPDKGHFYRSDQFNFAKVGVPAAYFDSGTDFVGKPAGWGAEQIEGYEKNDYHQPSDEYHDTWNLSGAVEDVRMDFFLGVAVADAQAMPHWNKGDEFEAARQKALADLKSR